MSTFLIWVGVILILVLVARKVKEAFYVEPCKHQWGPCSEEGRQHCIHCNIARDVRCSHKWEITDQRTITKGSQTVSIIKELTCTKCHDVKISEIKARN